jgi:predicted RNA-binding protein (virulence factor B family)
MKIVEDRVEVFISYDERNITQKVNKFLEEKAAEIEEVRDIKLSTLPILSSHDTHNQMIVTVLIHYKIRQEVNDRA